MKAAKLFAEGKLRQAEISRRLGVSRTSVHRWYHGWREEGRKGLRKAGRAGRLPRIGREELRRLDRALRLGAIAHGFATEMWTLPRVARLIEDLTGVRYHPAHVWRILHGLNWTVQRPARRAKERNERQIQRWIREDWPRAKNARRQRAWLVFEDETGLTDRPPIRSTWAPRGQTPVVTHPYRWNKMSVAAALGYRWDGRRCRLLAEPSSRPDGVLIPAHDRR
jgi:transposase